MLILNIGLVTSLNHFKGGNLPQGAILDEATVFNIFEDMGFATVWLKRGNSTTEPTLIVGVDHTRGLSDGDYIRLGKIATALQQDCIAVFDAVTGRGHLIGDYAADWGGEFNPEYFLLG